MKKRIIASTMASVMALGAVSSMVASADVADFKDQSATKSDLEKLMKDKEITDLIDGGIDNYGSKSGEKFQKAVDFANAVLEDDDATNDDYSVAYQMVKAAKGALQQYTKDDLKLLLSQCKGAFNTNNQLNDDDAKYTESTWDAFSSAYDSADSSQDSDDILETTDAYEELDDAFKKLNTLPTKTKAQIEAARKAYQDALKKEYDFQPWQRGTVSGTKTDYDGKTFAWGALYANIASGEDAVMKAYNDFTEIKGRTVTSNPTIVDAVDAMNEAASVLKAFDSKLDSASSKGSVTTLLANYQGQLAYTYDMQESLDLINSFISAAEGATDKKGHAGVAEAVNKDGKYDEITGTLSAADADDFWCQDWSKADDFKPLGDNKTNGGGKVSKLLDAYMEVRSSAEIYYIVDLNKKNPNNKNPIKNVGGEYFFSSKPVAGDKEQVKTLAANVKLNVSDLIEVTPEDVINGIATAESVTVTPTTAMNAALTAINTLWTGSLGLAATAFTAKIDDALTAVTGATTSTTGSATELTPTELTALTSAYTDFKAAYGSISSVGTALTAGDVTSTIDTLIADYAATNSKLTAAISALDALTVSTRTGGAYNVTSVISAAKGDINTALATFKTEYDKLAPLKDTYDDAYFAALADEVSDLSKSGINKVYDKVNEGAANGTAWKYDSSEGKQTKGILFFADSGDTTSAFNTTSPYVSSREDGKTSEITVASLGLAMVLYRDAIATSPYMLGVEDLDNISYLSEMDAGKSYPKAWRLIYNYMKYALEDEFNYTANATYKRTDIIKLQKDAQDLIDKCIDTELFSDSVTALALNDNAATEWLKLSNADKSKYKDNDSKYDVVTVGKGKTSISQGSSGDKDSTAMYNALKETYDQLNKEFKAFQYGYSDIVAKMASIAKELDSNKFDTATTKKLADELNDTALKFVAVESVKQSDEAEFTDSELFNDDGTMNKNNRLFTNGGEFKGVYRDGSQVNIAESKGSGKPNHSHYLMQTAYETLVKDYDAAVKALEEGDKLVQDVDGSGKLDVNDAVALMGIILNASDTSTATNKDIAKYDYDANGVVDVNDIVALVNAILAG